MLRRTTLTVLAMMATSSPLAGQDWAKKMFQTTEHDFGTVARSAKADFDFVFTNLYLEGVHVAGARSSCGCTSVEVVTPSLNTYERGVIRATFNTRAFLGSRGATVTVTLDKPLPAEIQLQVKGYIRSDVIFEPGSVQFGEVEQGQAVERSVSVGYAGRSDWQITGVNSSNPHVSATLVDAGRSGGQVFYQLHVRLSPNAPSGYLSDHLTLATNDGQGTQIPLAIEGRIVSGITVSPSTLFLGVVKPGQEVTKPLVVKAKKPFRILSITCDDKSFRFGKENDPSAKPVHVVPVTFLAGPNSGKVAKTIRIQTDLGQMAPELAAYAVISPPAEANN